LVVRIDRAFAASRDGSRGGRIAALTANHRQQQQLDHDRQLQGEQLAYDREQRNRQRVNETIDEATRGADAAIRSMADYIGVLLTGDEERSELRSAATSGGPPMLTIGPMEALQKAMAEPHRLSQVLYEVSIELVSQNLRLGLRLGPAHPVTTGHEAFQVAYRARHEALRPMYLRTLTADDHELIEASDKPVGEALQKFIDVCRNWMAEG
jgi:hypothetical protein